MSLLEAVLLATNFLTLNLLVMSMRSTKRWIAAYNDADRSFKRYTSKQETAEIRNENGGW